MSDQNQPMEQSGIRTTQVRWAVSRPDRASDPTSFLESFGPNAEGPQIVRDGVIDHRGLLVSWNIDNRPGEPGEPVIAFSYRVKVQTSQPLRAAEIEELSSTLYSAMDRLVRRRFAGDVDGARGPG